MNVDDEHIIARLWCPHGHSFYVVDKCPETKKQPHEAVLTELTRKEKKALKKGKL